MSALLAGIGVGSIIAAAIGWAVAISNHRQAWINALRDDVAIFLKELEVMHYAIRDVFAAKTAEELVAAETAKRDARVAVIFAQNRICDSIGKKSCTKSL